MIVTRQRRKSFPWGRLLLPLIAIGLAAFALWWPPSHAVIFSGKMSSFWTSATTVYDRAAKPFHFAEQDKVITSLNQKIATLTATSNSQASDLLSAKKKLAKIQSELEKAQADLAQARSVPVTKSANATASTRQAAAGTSAFSGTSTQRVYGDLASGATPDMRRTAAAWAAMDPDVAAKVLQRLPIPYVARVMALMSTDNVAAILDALPSQFAAKLTQENPDLRK